MNGIWKQRSKRRRAGASAVSALLLYTIVAMGAVVGLVTLRNQMVQEYGDLSVGLDQLDQSWEVKYSWEADSIGYNDPGPRLPEGDPEDEEPGGISVQVPPVSED